MKTLSLFLILIAMSSSSLVLASGDHDKAAPQHAEENHHEEGHAEHDKEGVVKLSQEQMQEAGIVVKSLQLQTVSANIRAAGEVMLNAYRIS